MLFSWVGVSVIVGTFLQKQFGSNCEVRNAELHQKYPCTSVQCVQLSGIRALLLTVEQAWSQVNFRAAGHDVWCRPWV